MLLKVVLIILKNMKVSWDDYSQYMESHKPCSKPPISNFTDEYVCIRFTDDYRFTGHRNVTHCFPTGTWLAWDFPGFEPLLSERAIRTATITPLKGRHLSPGKRIAEAKLEQHQELRNSELSCQITIT